MHPAYRSDKPGIAPDCGMELEPVFEGESGSSGVSLPPGSVSLSAERQQLIGIRMGTASRSSGSRMVRTTGRVVADDSHLYRIMAGTDGWIESLGNNPPGTLVKKGEELAKLYSPEFRTAETTYLGFIVSVERLKQSMNASDMRQVEESSRFNEEQLRLFGMGDEQIKQLRETHRQTSVVNLASPGDGMVLSRSISPRQRFEKGAELFRIADLSKVWIVADVHGDDSEARPGTRVKVTVPELGKTIAATVSATMPLFDEASRTLKMRLEANNPGFLLRPDMLVDVEFEAKAPPGLSIPAEAVLDSGLRKIVYVETSEGIFEPRPIEIAGAYGNRVAVASGITEGDRIVVSGNFLLDSESRMRMAGSAGSASPSEGKPAIQHKETGTRQPEDRAAMQMPHETKAAAHIGAVVALDSDPVCGMTLKPEQVKFTESYRGRTFRFCSDSCHKKFLADPGKYAVNIAANEGMTKDMAAHSHD
jgi:Cu(I)/Ag(I) efflux system membrane fusion protein